MPPHVSKTNRHALRWMRMPIAFAGCEFWSGFWVVMHVNMCAEKHLHSHNSQETKPCLSTLCYSWERERERAADIRLTDVSQPCTNTRMGPLVCMLRVSPAGWHCYMHVWTGLVWWRAWLHLSEGWGTGSDEASLLAQHKPHQRASWSWDTASI